MRFEDCQEPSLFDGLSGSPVFRVVRMTDEVRFIFAGVLVQGSYAAKIGYFIGCKAVVEMLARLEKGGAMKEGVLEAELHF